MKRIQYEIECDTGLLYLWAGLPATAPIVIDVPGYGKVQFGTIKMSLLEVPETAENKEDR